MFQRFVLGLAGLVAAASVSAQSGPWQEGKHYFRIDPPQATEHAGKVEVTEVFSYGCPACFSAAPKVKNLKAKLPPNAVMTYVPASWNQGEQWPLFQRSYYTALALGVADKAHDDMFTEIWGGRSLAVVVNGKIKNPPPTMEDVAKFYEKYGVKAADFTATSSSFAINTKMKKAEAYIKATQVDSTPTFIVNGKYRLNGQSAGSWENLEAIILHLVAQESAAAK
ncbi:MAG TPA: thiol:disulfide interchange protein DsbA/DsbL [Tahibacter sp.]|uniref:thiol:disulfide interchange protein DsbA/DsbL n=1 Tax=Tahibacter sp. TaxID=2056211 RepID=UPI002BCD9809|nr:thiol:disulfide interchange protein DsbA/DsbL [Tahibacter sp.]HSX58587.1 thiol:disulfide interchange protein DsbA/DsbL [Tahibacter sp.]